MWEHGREELDRFLQHLNGINSTIQFTVEKVADGKLNFLDVSVFKERNGRSGHAVYRKPPPTAKVGHYKDIGGQSKEHLTTVITRRGIETPE